VAVGRTLAGLLYQRVSTWPPLPAGQDCRGSDSSGRPSSGGQMSSLPAKIASSQAAAWLRATSFVPPPSVSGVMSPEEGVPRLAILHVWSHELREVLAAAATLQSALEDAADEGPPPANASGSTRNLLAAVAPEQWAATEWAVYARWLWFEALWAAVSTGDSSLAAVLPAAAPFTPEGDDDDDEDDDEEGSDEDTLTPSAALHFNGSFVGARQADLTGDAAGYTLRLQAQTTRRPQAPIAPIAGGAPGGAMGRATVSRPAEKALSAKPHAGSTGRLVQCVSSYTPVSPTSGEMQVRAGDVIKVLRTDASGWSFGAIVPPAAGAKASPPGGAQEGWFPSAFVAPVVGP